MPPFRLLAPALPALFALASSASAQKGPLPPEQALAALKVAEGFQVERECELKGSDEQKPAMGLPGATFTTPVFDAQLKTAETRADALIAQEAGSAQ